MDEMNEKCATCYFWKQTTEGDKVEIGQPLVGICRRFPPACAGLVQRRHPITGEVFLGPVFAIPDVVSDHGCGEWKPKILAAND